MEEWIMNAVLGLIIGVLFGAVIGLRRIIEMDRKIEHILEKVERLEKKIDNVLEKKVKKARRTKRKK